MQTLKLELEQAIYLAWDYALMACYSDYTCQDAQLHSVKASMWLSYGTELVFTAIAPGDVRIDCKIGVPFIGNELRVYYNGTPLDSPTESDMPVTGAMRSLMRFIASSLTSYCESGKYQMP